MIDQELRARRVGCSEFGAILGCDPYQDEVTLAAEKLGLFKRPPPTEAMDWGRILQQPIIDKYNRVTGHQLEWCDQTFEHPDYPFLCWTPDALNWTLGIGADAKLVLWNDKRRWGETPDEIPLHIQAQIAGYMAASGFGRWDVAALINWRVLIYTFYRDLEVETALLRRIELWWDRHICKGIPPPIGASEASERWLKEYFPRNISKIREATPDEIDLLEEYACVRGDEAGIVEQRKQLENEIKLQIAEADGLYWRRGRFTWKRTKDTEEIDWKTLSQGLLQQLPEAERKTLIGLHTVPKPGYRRIDWRYEGEDSND